MPRGTLSVVQGMSAAHTAANSRRDRRRGSQSYNNSNSNSDKISYRNGNSNGNGNGMNSSNSSSEYNSVSGNSNRFLNNNEENTRRVSVNGVLFNSHVHTEDIRHWLFIDQNGGDIMVRSTLSHHFPHFNSSLLSSCPYYFLLQSSPLSRLILPCLVLSCFVSS